MVNIKSTVGIKSTLNRLEDRTLFGWLKNKRSVDGAEGLWRIHNNLYDFTKFIDNHPGGQDWLLLTKGTDITEAFESHHISLHAEGLLKKYFVRITEKERSYPFTFNENDFYKTLKHNVRETLKTISTKSSTKKSKVYIDILLMCTFIFSILAAKYSSFILIGISAYFLTCLTIAAHNYFHKKDNFRMYYFDLSFMSSRDWRISHVLSHHLYTNTIRDLEISLFEPFFQYLPIEKSFLYRYSQLIYFIPVISFIFFMSVGMRYKNYLLKIDSLRWTEFIPFTLPLLMYFFGKMEFISTIYTWLLIVLLSSLIFGIVGMAAHHHPLIFHDGDTPRKPQEMDWGLFQLDTVMDRTDITGSHYLVLTNFGDHGLHHLFPTLDHGLLQQLYPVFEQTAKKFNIHLRMKTELQMLGGLFQQLARVKSNNNPPYQKNK